MTEFEFKINKRKLANPFTVQCRIEKDGVKFTAALPVIKKADGYIIDFSSIKVPFTLLSMNAIVLP